MPITINGSGTLTGISAGGLPDGSITADDIAAGAVTSAKLAAGAGGKVAQVVQSIITTEFPFTSSTYQDATNFNLSITPTNSNSKVLVLLTANVFLDNFSAGDDKIIGKIVRGSTDIFESHLAGGYGSHLTRPTPLIYLDSPATTSATTYKLQVRVTGAYNTSRINPSFYTAAKSTITLIEVLP